MLLVPADYLPAGMTIHGGAVAGAMINFDFPAWTVLKLMSLIPGGLTQTMLGTDQDVVLAADPGEKARIRQILEHLLSVSARLAGMKFGIETAAAHEP